MRRKRVNLSGTSGRLTRRQLYELNAANGQLISSQRDFQGYPLKNLYLVLGFARCLTPTNRYRVGGLVLVSIDYEAGAGLIPMRPVPESGELYLSGPFIARTRTQWQSELFQWIPNSLTLGSLGRIIQGPSASMEAIKECEKLLCV